MRYQAFFSYARADDKLANWLHRQLDGYRTPKALIAQEGALGPVPAKLHPIFRDRTDLDARGHIDQRLQEALEDSECLVVLCTPTSAKSQWVNHECETFLRLGREARIFAVIGAGEPNSGDPETECFPPALRGRGLLAADLRDLRRPNGQVVGDGREGGRLKLVAGLLGVPLDHLVQRERRRLRQTTAVLSIGIAVFAAVSIAAVLFANLASLAQARAERSLTRFQEQMQYQQAALEIAVRKFVAVDFAVTRGGQAQLMATRVPLEIIATNETQEFADTERRLGCLGDLPTCFGIENATPTTSQMVLHQEGDEIVRGESYEVFFREVCPRLAQSPPQMDQGSLSDDEYEPPLDSTFPFQIDCAGLSQESARAMEWGGYVSMNVFSRDWIVTQWRIGMCGNGGCSSTIVFWALRNERFYPSFVCEGDSAVVRADEFGRPLTGLCQNSHRLGCDEQFDGITIFAFDASDRIFHGVDRFQANYRMQNACTEEFVEIDGTEEFLRTPVPDWRPRGPRN